MSGENGAGVERLLKMPDIAHFLTPQRAFASLPAEIQASAIFYRDFAPQRVHGG